jgi:hypothetical protein
MSAIALCKCGTDMSLHDGMDHEFDASGTRHVCGEPVDGFLCARPAYHQEQGVPCGPLTGRKLW